MCTFTFRFATMLLCALVFAACGQQPTQEGEPVSEPPQSTQPVAEHMGEHFEQVAAAQKALIRGDLEGIREPVNWMASHQSVIGAPEGWAPHIQEMRSAARTATGAFMPNRRSS